MKTIKMMGLAVVAVLALSAVAASAASAEEFEASETGTLSGKAVNTQVFKTGSAATVECTKLDVLGTVAAGELKGSKKEISVDYLNCVVKGIGGSATVTLSDYTFFVTPNKVSVLKAIKISASAAGVECEVEVESGQTLGTGAGEIVYKNKGKNLEVEAKVTGIKSEITKSNSGLFCGTVGTKNTTGTYTGTSEIELNSGVGTIDVK
jgi:hypothetical protein